MEKTTTLRDILTSEEMAKVNELRIGLLKSESSWERNYYDSEIRKIFKQAKQRHFSKELVNQN